MKKYLLSHRGTFYDYRSYIRDLLDSISKGENFQPIEIKTSNRWRFIYQTNTGNSYFLDEKRRYYLSEFVSIKNCDIFKNFDGIMYDTYFSGKLLKLEYYGDKVKIYNYFCG